MANDLVDGKVNYNNCVYITEKQASGLRKGFAKPGDVLLTHKATIGRTAIVSDEYDTIVLTPQVTYYRAITGINNQYLKYYFDTNQFQQLFANWAGSGSTRAYLGITAQRKLPIVLPPIEIQNKIVNILSALDDKITLNNKINANFQQQAQAIFKSWFVDFELFQDGEFVESELGPIPKGWRVGELSEIATITMGQSPSGKSYNEEGNGSVFFQGRAEFGNRFPTRRLYTTEPKRMAEANSVLMSVRAPVGDINVAYEKCCIGRGLASIQSKFEYSSYMLYQMLSLKRQLDVFNGEGTVFGSINRDTLNAMKVLIPDEDSIEKFECIVAPMDKLVRTNYDEICRLEILRDTLLPKLMSGELSVNEVQ